MSEGSKSTIGLIVNALGVIAVVLVAVLLFKFVEEWRAANKDLDTKMEFLGTLIQATQTSTTVKMEDLENQCFANAITGATCTFTNQTNKPVSTCFKGQLSRKTAGGSLHSLIGCTGRLLPNETKSISLPWVGGSVNDVCFDLNDKYRTPNFDFCDFTVEQML